MRKTNVNLVEAISRERQGYKEKRSKDETTAEDSSTARNLKNIKTIKPIKLKTKFIHDNQADETIDFERVSHEREARSIRLEIAGLEDEFEPATGWEDARLPSEVFGVFKTSKHGTKLDSPTPVQAQLWPCILSGIDCIAIAPTGSGKTLAYVLPAVCHALGNPRKRSRAPSCLILGPTRELVSQISSVVSRVCKLVGLSSRSAYGGDQVEELDEDTPLDILVATPGRCLDIVAQSKQIRLKKTSLLVLDEADRMLQLGFQPDIDAILSYLPPNRQTVLVSASWTSQSESTAEKWFNSEKKVKILVGLVAGSEHMHLSGGRKVEEGSSEINDDKGNKQSNSHANEQGGLTLSSDVEQTVHVCAEHKKPRKLIRHIERVRKREVEKGLTRNPGPMLVFCNKIKTVLFVHEFLAKQGVRVCAIHGSMPQPRREKALNEFRAGKFVCMVATDVAGRGLDLPNLAHIVNYDFPGSLTQYVHRVGRCGRGKNKMGTALSFFTRNLSVMAPDLATLLTSAKQKIDPNLAALAKEYSEAAKDTNKVLDNEADDSDVDFDAPYKNEKDLLEVAEEEESHDDDDEQAETINNNVSDDVDNEDNIDFAFDMGSGDDDDDNDSNNDEEDAGISPFDFAGAVPLKPFTGLSSVKSSGVSSSEHKSSKFKRPRGVRGGKKSRAKKMRKV